MSRVVPSTPPYLVRPMPAVTESSSPFTAPVLLATDGTANADGAVALALQLEHERHADVQVVTVIDPTPSIAGTRARRAGYDVERREQREAEVREQLARLRMPGTAVANEEILVEEGSAVAIIAREAAAREAALVVMGLRTHGIIDRVFRDETTLRVLRRVRAPLLGVTAGLRALPKHAVVAMDFGRSSVAAMRAAIPLLATGATLRLVHVEPVLDQLPEATEGRRAIYEHGVTAAFDRLLAGMTLPPGLVVERVVRSGPIFAELEDELREHDTDLLVLGTTRHDMAERLSLGRLTSAFVRSAGLSVLVAPPAVER